ncbi:Similar to Nuclear protein localization protein 4; acc. no. A7EGK5 [Pyronema omphalodes CBS 100304]|uniref:Nuclear protein localization protein 4 n=1 Tax=Pyronema omphalodes (strain CBS 100304) TaxID=1076935 RepID=U4KYE1_PYROM|nr:Similar to Nuclear protein localization protein 4; acc. no. A7EGK5 [Pyronema omphalodes CBS 100304]
MPPSTMMLRFRTPDGMLRIQLQLAESIASLQSKLVEAVPKDVQPNSFTLSDEKRTHTYVLSDILNKQVQDLGLKHGDMLFLDYTKGAAPTAVESTAATSVRLNGQPVKHSDDISHKYTRTTAGLAAHDVVKHADPWETVVQDEVDDTLEKLDGKISRKKDHKMCKHGDKAMCDYCMPVEPYDSKYLTENGIKHLSFHAHLRKSNTLTNRPELKASYIPPLNEDNYRIKKNCPSGHAAWPEGICSKCQPSAITLSQQTFRMVDHVEFSNSETVDNFIEFWRQSGKQRIGYLYGRYEPYSGVPLGIKAVVEAIYEPPQVSESDGVTLSLPWDKEKDVDAMAALSDEEGKPIIKRHIDSYFLSSLEVVFAARLQASRPSPSKWSETGYFGSKFVTCVVSGEMIEAGEEKQRGIGVSAYQVSNSAVEMVRADIIEPSTEPGKMLVREEDGKSRYIPEVFFRHKNEYGVNVQENAKPAFPVEYLLVSLTNAFLQPPNPLFKTNKFPIENREHEGRFIKPDFDELATQLGIKNASQNGGSTAISDFHLLCHIKLLDILGPKELELLAQFATTGDMNIGNQLVGSGNWQTLITIIRTSGGLSPQPFISTKRRFEDEDRATGSGSGSMKNDNDERLTKRLRGVSLMDPLSRP